MEISVCGAQLALSKLASTRPLFQPHSNRRFLAQRIQVLSLNAEDWPELWTEDDPAELAVIFESIIVVEVRPPTSNSIYLRFPVLLNSGLTIYF